MAHLGSEVVRLWDLVEELAAQGREAERGAAADQLAAAIMRRTLP
jgi:hypothetical protein